MQTDEKGNRYLEFERTPNEKIRMTYIPNREWKDLGVVLDVIRIQAVYRGEKPRHGPEIPVDRLGDFVSDLINLLKSQVQEKK